MKLFEERKKERKEKIKQQLPKYSFTPNINKRSKKLAEERNEGLKALTENYKFGKSDGIRKNNGDVDVEFIASDTIKIKRQASPVRLAKASMRTTFKRPMNRSRAGSIERSREFARTTSKDYNNDRSRDNFYTQSVSREKSPEITPFMQAEQTIKRQKEMAIRDYSYYKFNEGMERTDSGRMLPLDYAKEERKISKVSESLYKTPGKHDFPKVIALSPQRESKLPVVVKEGVPQETEKRKKLKKKMKKGKKGKKKKKKGKLKNSAGGAFSRMSSRVSSKTSGSKMTERRKEMIKAKRKGKTYTSGG
jgi:hypothetical protein